MWINTVEGENTRNREGADRLEEHEEQGRS